MRSFAEDQHSGISLKGWIAGVSALLCTASCAATGSAEATATTSQSVELSAEQSALLDSHVRGFAQSYCLRSLDDKGLEPDELFVMRDQGQRWTSIIVQRSYGDIEKLLALIPVVDAAIAATDMTFVRGDETGTTLAAPAYYCAELIRQKEVKAAIEKAKLDLSESYLAA